MKTVLVTEPIHDAGLELLKARGDFRLLYRPDDIPAAIAEANAIGVRTYKLDEAMLSRATNLEIVAKHGIGTDAIPVEYLTGRGVPVAIAAGANTTSVTEHTLMLMLAACRRLVEANDAVRTGQWMTLRSRAPAIDLSGRSLLVVGFGRIGRTIAHVCRAFGMHVAAYDPALTEAEATTAGVRWAPDLDAGLAEAEIVTLHMPLVDGTRNLFDADRIGRMKTGAVLVNCARGGIVDEAGLAAALTDGRLAAAGFDVLADEPPRADNPLLHAPNVVLTPHSAAHSRDAAKGMAVAMAQNILAALDGRLDRSVVINPTVLDRERPA